MSLSYYHVFYRIAPNLGDSKDKIVESVFYDAKQLGEFIKQNETGVKSILGMYVSSNNESNLGKFKEQKNWRLKALKRTLDEKLEEED